MEKEKNKMLQKVIAIIPESREEELRKEIPDIFNNPEVKIEIVTDHLFLNYVQSNKE